MFRLLTVLFFWISAFTLADASNEPDNSQAGFPKRFRNLQSSSRHANQTINSSLRENHRTEDTGMFTGIRRLVPQEYSTIQSAIDSCVHGDTVLVSAGIYVENIRFHGKAIVVASLYLIDGDTSHIAKTIIDGSNPSHPDSASVVYFVDGEDTTSVLNGLTITGGAGTPWTLQNTWQAGGGVFCDSVSGATIINNRITENQVSGANASGAGVFFYGNQGYLILEGNRIFGNRVSSPSGYGIGGGADMIGEDMYGRVIGNIFERNSVVAHTYAVAGALDLGGLNSPAGGVIKNNMFKENSVVFKFNKGNICEIPYNKIDNIKPDVFKIFGVSVRDPTDNTYSLRYKKSEWRGIQYLINENVANLLKEKIKNRGSSLHPAPSR